MKVTIIGGTGYIGLVTGLGLAVHGHEVICVDIDEQKIKALNEGILPIYEDGLNALLTEAQSLNTITFTSTIEFSIRQSDIIMVAVGTPSTASGKTDMSQIEAALKSLAQYIDCYKVIVIKSTVPVGTCKMVRTIVQQNLKRHHTAFDIVSNPEFLREGKAVTDFLYPERIVIGTETKRAKHMMQTLYHSFNAPIIFTDITSSEMIKYACNTYLATRLSFINEIADISEKVGANIHSVIAGMSYDKRIGRHYLNPGPGFGGPCLNKDIKSLIYFGDKAGANVDMLKAVLNRNTRQITNITQYVMHHITLLGIKTEHVNVAILGLSFKAGTDDIRNAPAIKLIDELILKGVCIKAYDPVVKHLHKRHQGIINIKERLIDAVEDAHFIIIMTEWSEFKKMDLKQIKASVKYPSILDTRNIINAVQAQELGFVYKGIGISNTSNIEANCVAL